MALLPADKVADDLAHGGEVRGARRSLPELFAFLLGERAELFQRSPRERGQSPFLRIGFRSCAFPPCGEYAPAEGVYAFSPLM